MAADLVLIRHGETDWNRAMRFQGQSDVPLNDVGLAQADRIAARLGAETVDTIVSSDLDRAMRTALPAAALLGLPVAPEPGLREQCFGYAEGRTGADIRAERPEAWEQWLAFHADGAFPGGESTRQFFTRTVDTVRRLAATHPGQRLLVFTHGGVLDMVFRAARALSLDGPRLAEIPNAGYNRIRVADEGAIEIVVWADTAHLDGLPAQPVYDQTRYLREREQRAAELPPAAAA